MRAVRLREVPGRAVPCVPRGGRHSAARPAALPGAGGTPPGTSGNNPPYGDRATERRRGGGLGRRLSVLPEPNDYAPVTGPGENNNNNARAKAPACFDDVGHFQVPLYCHDASLQRLQVKMRSGLELMLHA